jgi:hypothetical protein
VPRAQRQCPTSRQQQQGNEKLDNLHRESLFNGFLADFTSLLISSTGLLLSCSTCETERIIAGHRVLRFAGRTDACARLVHGAGVVARRIFMNDLIYVGIVVAFFVVSALYVRFCEKL